MALGMMGGSGGSWGNNGAGGSWDDDEKKRKEQQRSAGALGIGGIGSYAQKAANRNQAAQEVRTAYNPTEQSRANNAATLNSLGVNATNPYVTGTPKPAPLDKNNPSIFTGRASELAQQPIKETYVENAQPNTPARIGFNPVKNPQSIKSTGNNSGFVMPTAPSLGWSERNDRNNLLAKISTPHKGSQNGQLTANQMQLMAGINERDQKYANDQYGTQVNAASQLAQTQMSQDGANQRAVLGESGTNERFNTQLGFDAGKFQQTAEQQQQANGLASRRLDIEQSNSDVANFAPKQLNALYEKYDTAQSDEDRTAIAAQIQALKGTASDKEYWTNISGGESLSDDGLTSTKNPDVLLNRNTGETKQQSKGERSFSDPKMLALQARTDISMEEKERLANLYLDGGDI